MGKIKCMRAIRRVKNMMDARHPVQEVRYSFDGHLIGPRFSQKLSFIQKHAKKGRLHSGMNKIDKDLVKLLKMEGKSNKKAKSIERQTYYAYKRASA